MSQFNTRFKVPVPSQLSVSEKQELSRRLGVTRFQVLDDLFEISRLATYF